LLSISATSAGLLRASSCASATPLSHIGIWTTSGFGQLLRVLLGREKNVGIYGPTGLIDAVEHKLGDLVFHVTEIDTVGRLTFRGRNEAAILDHGEVVLAFALEERAQINVWRNKVEAMGLSIGPWLRAFKERPFAGRLTTL
jgi:ribonuclease Z